MLYRYSRWDGSQQIEALLADELMDEIANDVLGEGDLRSALRRMMERGAQLPSGRRMSGLRDLLERLKNRRSDNLSRYNLGSVLDDIKERLEQIVCVRAAKDRERLNNLQGQRRRFTRAPIRRRRRGMRLPRARGGRRKCLPTGPSELLEKLARAI